MGHTNDVLYEITNFISIKKNTSNYLNMIAVFLHQTNRMSNQNPIQYNDVYYPT